MSSSSFFASNCCSGSTLCPNPGWVIVADVLDAPPSPYDPGALYLVSETPTSDTEFEGHAGEYTWFSSAAQQWEFCDAVLGDKVTVENDDSCTIWCYGLSGWSEIDLGGLSYSGVNLDVGAGTFPVFSQVTAGGQFQFFPLEAGSNIVLSYNGNRLRISANTGGGGGSGETNTASNLANNPASEIFGLFKQKTGVVLDFYALELGDNIEGTLYSDRLRLDVVIPTIPPATILQNIGTGTIPVFKSMASNVAQMYKFEVSTENSDVFNLALDAANNKLDINFTPSAGLVSMFSDMLFLYLLSGEPPNEDDQIAYFPGLGWVATPRTPSTAGSGELIIDPLPAASFGVDHYKGLLAGSRMTVATVGNDIVFTADDMNNDGSNEGGGDAEVYIGLSSGTLQFRTISGLSGITVAENGDVIEITNDGVVTITNVGAGVKLYDDVTGIVAGDASLRTLVSPDSSVDITLNGDEVELTIPDWSSLLANIGTGDGWVKTGPPWEIKSIIAQNGVSATANANDITIEGDYTVQNDGGGVGVLKDALSGVIKAYTLVAGVGMSISRVGDLITFTNTGGGGSPSAACVSAHYGLSANQTLANAGYVSDFFVVDIDTANLSDPDVVDTGGGVFEFQSTARRFVQAQVTLYPGAGQERLKVKIQFKPSGGSWGDLETLSYGYSPNNALDQQSVITLPVPIDGESGDQFRVVAGTEGSSVDAEIDYEATRMVVWTCGSGAGGGVTDFTDLGDVPGSYSSQALKHVRVNAGETALEFVTPTFLQLNDTMASFTASRYVQVNGGGTALQNGVFTGTWASLTDTAATTGTRGQIIRKSTTLDPAWLPMTFLASALIPGDFTATTKTYSSIDHPVIQSADDSVDNTFYVVVPMPFGWNNHGDWNVGIGYECNGSDLDFTIRLAATAAAGDLTSLSWTGTPVTGSDTPTGTGDYDFLQITGTLGTGTNEGDWLIIEITVDSSSTYTELNILNILLQ